VNIGTLAVVIAVVVALAFGMIWRMREGRVVRKGTSGGAPRPVYEHLPEQLRERLSGPQEETARVTLLQLSTTFCAPCRHTRILLSDLAQRTPGLRHVEVDLTDHPEWSTPLRVHRTPATLVLDDAGRELFRVMGLPRRDELVAALRPHLGEAHPT
jgi:thiol-disulfide isomerase/thioredoxin